jgi:hypothetical protein
MSARENYHGQYCELMCNITLDGACACDFWSKLMCVLFISMVCFFKIGCLQACFWLEQVYTLFHSQKKVYTLFMALIVSVSFVTRSHMF